MGRRRRSSSMQTARTTAWKACKLWATCSLDWVAAVEAVAVAVATVARWRVAGRFASSSAPRASLRSHARTWGRVRQRACACGCWCPCAWGHGGGVVAVCSGHVPQSNGCGPAGLKMDMGLDGAEECCNMHDKVGSAAALAHELSAVEQLTRRVRCPAAWLLHGVSATTLAGGALASARRSSVIA